MAGQINISPELLKYTREVSLRDDKILQDLRDETAGLPGGAAMQVMEEEGQFLALLVKVTGSVSVLEIGTFTGYSTLCMARALPTDGRLVTCDITDRWPEIGARYWKRAGVADLVDVRIGNAVDTLGNLIREEGTDVFDLAFIDADKTNYPKYYESTLSLVRPGGLIIVDNTLFSGRVVDSATQDAETVTIRAFNTLLRDDERVDMCMLTMADGITLARKRTVTPPPDRER